jgi:hypothetical protein
MYVAAAYNTLFPIHPASRRIFVPPGLGMRRAEVQQCGTRGVTIRYNISRR